MSTPHRPACPRAGRALLLCLVMGGLGALRTVDAHAQAAGVVATRDQLAEAYLRLDYLIRDFPVPAAGRAAFNGAFDGATLQFFAGRFDQTLATIDSLASVLVPDAARRERGRQEAAGVLEALAPSQRLLHVQDGEPIPFHLYAPPGVTGPVPLVIALHGAGGDERMFMAGYGAGAILSLAKEHGFAVLSPPTAAVMNRPDRLEALVAAVSVLVPLDRSRIYLLGHSMGAGAAWGLARQPAAGVAAVACIAGGCGAGGEGPPLLVIAAEVDPLARPGPMQAAVEAARAAGQLAEFQLAEGWGHTLVVGAVLPSAVEWLLQHRRPTPERPDHSAIRHPTPDPRNPTQSPWPPAPNPQPPPP